MVAPQATFHGTHAEGLALVDATSRNCSCEMPLGVRLTTCPVHAAIVGDQRFLDGLVFARRIARQLRLEEFGPS